VAELANPIAGGIVRRNFVLNVVDGAVYSFGMSFVSRSTVLPVFVAAMGGGNLAIGLIPVVWLIGFHFPQILIANRARGTSMKKRLMLRTALVQRLPWLIIALATLFVLEPLSPTLALLVFFVLFGLAAIGGSLNLPVWFDLLAKITPVRIRGRLFGWRMMLGATLGIVGGLVVERVLETMAYPGNFALLFGLAFAATMISYTFLTLLREDDDGDRPRSIRFRDYLGEIPSIVRSNRTFRNFLVADALLAMVIMAEAFYTIYAFQKFDLTAGFAGRFTVMVMASMVIGNLLFGYLADRYGHRLNLVVMAGITIVACILALWAPTVEVFYFVFMAAAFGVSLQGMSRMPFIAEICGERDRATFIALSNVFTAPFYLAGIAAGIIANRFGYEAIFVITAVIAAFAALWLLTMVPEPRTSAERAHKNE
jgi:MFS family permease